MTHQPDNGRTIGAAKDTASFVRAQVARGVSAETLRRRFGIKPQHMLELLAGPPRDVLPKARSDTPSTIAAGFRLAMPPPSKGLTNAEIARRAQQNREEANRLARLVLPVVAKIARFDRRRIDGADKTTAAQDIRAMVFALMHELAPTCPLQAVGAAIGQRQAVVVERALARCQRMRTTSTEYNAHYLRALSRLAP